MKSKYLNKNNFSMSFWCPGCRTNHDLPQRSVVTGKPDFPTVRPVIENQGCSVFITNGMLEYFGSSHALSNRTVQMVVVAPDEVEEKNNE